MIWFALERLVIGNSSTSLTDTSYIPKKITSSVLVQQHSHSECSYFADSELVQMPVHTGNAVARCEMLGACAQVMEPTVTY